MKRTRTVKQIVARWVIYVLGLLILALGMTLNTKTGLGVACIMSVPFAVSELFPLNFGDATMVVFLLFIVFQMVVHWFMAKKKGEKAAPMLIMDALQLPVNLVFTRVVNLFSGMIPILSEGWPNGFLGSFWGRLLIMLAGMCCIGIGAAMTLNMRLVPNPADGLIQVLADMTHRPVGFTKNWVDVVNVCITVILSLIVDRRIVGIGLGTLISAFGTGRMMALTNRVGREKMCRAAGMPQG